MNRMQKFMNSAIGMLPDWARPPAPTEQELLTGEAYTDPSRIFPSSIFTPYNPSELVTRKGIEIFERMYQDEQVKAALNFKILSVLAGGWEIVSPGDQEEDWEVTAFVRDAFTHFPGGWNSALKKMLRGVKYGFSANEKVFARREEGPLAGRVTLDRLVECKPRYIDFLTDKSGTVEAVRQMPIGVNINESTRPDGVFSPLKFVHYVHDKEFENPYGRSDLEAAYRPWFVKDNVYKWYGMLMERYGIPPLFALYDPKKYQGADLESLKKVIRRIQAATMGMIPRTNKDDLELWSQSIAAGSYELFVAALARFDADIAKALLQPSLVGFAQESGNKGAQSGGSLARANISWKAFMMVVKELQEDISANAVNSQIIPQLCDLNFAGLKSYPLFQFARLDDEKELELFRLWSDLVKGGIVMRIEDDERHIRKSLGMPENEDVTLAPLPGATEPDADEEGKPIKDEDQTEEMRQFASANDGEWRLVMGHPMCFRKVA